MMWVKCKIYDCKSKTVVFTSLSIQACEPFTGFGPGGNKYLHLFVSMVSAICIFPIFKSRVRRLAGVSRGPGSDRCSGTFDGRSSPELDQRRPQQAQVHDDDHRSRGRRWQLPDHAMRVRLLTYLQSWCPCFICWRPLPSLQVVFCSLLASRRQMWYVMVYILPADPW